MTSLKVGACLISCINIVILWSVLTGRQNCCPIIATNAKRKNGKPPKLESFNVFAATGRCFSRVFPRCALNQNMLMTILLATELISWYPVWKNSAPAGNWTMAEMMELTYCTLISHLPLFPATYSRQACSKACEAPEVNRQGKVSWSPPMNLETFWWICGRFKVLLCVLCVCVCVFFFGGGLAGCVTGCCHYWKTTCGIIIVTCMLHFITTHLLGHY